MQTKIIEATNIKHGGYNWGKFMLGRFDEERSTFSAIDGRRSLLAACGWTPDHLLVVDLQTGEGALFRPGGSTRADLDKHRIWVCPLFEPFLMWLYRQDLSDLEALPAMVELDAPSAMAGYRRAGGV